MRLINYPGQLSFNAMCGNWVQQFLKTPAVMTGEWQSQDISDKPMLATREILNVSFAFDIPATQAELATETKANLPWAEDHFQERVSGEPLNPPPSEAYWPFAQQGNKAAKSAGADKFSHTYPERMWPKKAGEHGLMHGIRYLYGDLNDLVEQLKAGPLTRQAYLPIWFPEDTGGAGGNRVPCTLGYHFIIRNNKLQITYYIRSCDFMRHFRDDVYMASRLAQWVAQQINVGRAQGDEVVATDLIMHIVSFHVFEGDQAKLQMMAKEYSDERITRMMGGL